MKSKKSITRKLFAITSIVFIVFITTNLIVQSAFFEQFYIKWKKNNLEHNLVKFKSEYSLLQKNEDKINLVSSFEEDNNYKLIIRDRLGNLQYLTKTIDERKDSIKVRIMNQIMSSEIENNGGITKFKEEKRPLIFITEETSDMVASVSGILYAENNDEIVYAFASLQPVNEAVQVIKVF